LLTHSSSSSPAGGGGGCTNFSYTANKKQRATQLVTG
jgi:hypothetical protein